MIQTTKDLTIFKKHTANRPICEKNVQEIVDSILSCNMLDLRPILVNEDMEVIDGQHRLEACRKLNLPIYYNIQKKYRTEQIYLLNRNQKNWLIEDFLNYYVNIGNKEYIKFQEFIKQRNLSIRNGMLLTLSYKSLVGSNVRDVFKNGGYKFPTGEEFSKVQKNYSFSAMCIGFLRSRLPGNKNYIDTKGFLAALLIFSSYQDFDETVFMKKLEIRLDMMMAHRYTEAYVQMFINIYNWKNKDPINSN